MNKYLISIDEAFERLFICHAESEERARQIFLDFFSLLDDCFYDHIHERSVNMSFAERFWLETDQEAAWFMETGDCLATNDQFKERVREYFVEKPEYAELFINYYFSDYEEGLIYRFPDEMIKFIYLKDDNWLDIKIVDLGMIPVVNPLSSINR